MKKIEVVETLCHAAAELAPMLLVEFELHGVMSGHDLVADLLLSHHQTLTTSINTTVGFFTQVYKDANKCGRAVEDYLALYGLLFASVAAQEAAEANATIPAIKNPNPTDASAVTPAHDSSPVIGKALFQNTNDASVSTITEKSGENPNNSDSPVKIVIGGTVYEKAKSSKEDSSTEATTNDSDKTKESAAPPKENEVPPKESAAPPKEGTAPTKENDFITAKEKLATDAAANSLLLQTNCPSCSSYRL